MDVIKKEHIVDGSEYLETLLVAVPKYVDNVRSRLTVQEPYQGLAEQVRALDAYGCAAQFSVSVTTPVVFV